MIFALIVSTISMFACFGLAGVLREPWQGLQWGLVNAQDLLFVAPVLAIAIFLGGMFIGRYRARFDPRLLCPHCHGFLIDHPNLLVASRNCYHCGRQVLAKPETSI
jgi:hypothetical protein